MDTNKYFFTIECYKPVDAVWFGGCVLVVVSNVWKMKNRFRIRKPEKLSKLNKLFIQLTTYLVWSSVNKFICRDQASFSRHHSSNGSVICFLSNPSCLNVSMSVHVHAAQSRPKKKHFVINKKLLRFSFFHF